MYRRRNRESELIVAIAAVGTLVVALTFGIILTLSSNADESANQNKTFTAIARATDTDAVSAQTEEIELTQEPEITAELETPESTETTEATEAALPTREATNTPRVTDTEVAMVLTTAAPSRLPTEEALETDRPTNTRQPSNTPKPSNTPPSPTLTPSPEPPTNTPRPTNTITPTKSPTRRPSPEPPSPTWTPAATLTFTPYPTLTPSITPFGGERTNTPSAMGCAIPQGWMRYVVQPGDTMSQLSQRFNVHINALTEANCITDPNNVTAGQIVFAPPGSNVTPLPPVVGNITTVPSVAGSYPSYDCGDPSATITNPRAGTVLRGTFAVYGTAQHPNFSFYRLQISGGGTDGSEFLTLDDIHPAPVINGQLGI
ncbi:MAG TPA: LysM domain-containing protein, partial [Aggregatilineaceae bacterium]|nr:LysM domain-containing protein [Aggregatilineaceae bacterium]